VVESDWEESEFFGENVLLNCSAKPQEPRVLSFKFAHYCFCFLVEVSRTIFCNIRPISLFKKKNLLFVDSQLYPFVRLGILYVILPGNHNTYANLKAKHTSLWCMNFGLSLRMFTLLPFIEVRLVIFTSLEIWLIFNYSNNNSNNCWLRAYHMPATSTYITCCPFYLK
jgi:hypothetical protein